MKIHERRAARVMGLLERGWTKPLAIIGAPLQKMKPSIS